LDDGAGKRCGICLRAHCVSQLRGGRADATRRAALRSPLLENGVAGGLVVRACALRVRDLHDRAGPLVLPWRVSRVASLSRRAESAGLPLRLASKTAPPPPP